MKSDNTQDTNLAANKCRNYYEKRLSWRAIMSYTKDIALYCLFFILTVYATYQNNVPLKVSRARLPNKFTNSSWIQDFPSGKLTVTQNKVAFSEISFVLYYAPWCAQSKNVKEVYENVAAIFEDRIFFSSINCWQPAGECRIQYSNVPNWPTLMAYRSNGFGLQYNGQWSTTALVDFIQSLIYPLKRITDMDNLLRMSNSHGAVMLAFVDIEKNYQSFKTFYQVAIKMLELDPHREIGFAICTGDSSKLFGVNTTPRIRLYLWNETLEYSNPEWKVHEIIKYIKQSVHFVSRWISPNGAKSSSLASEIKSSLIMLFTPRIYSSSGSAYYEMIRQIGCTFHNCVNDTWINDMTERYIEEFRPESAKAILELIEACKFPEDMASLPEDDLKSPNNLINERLLQKCKTLQLESNLLQRQGDQLEMNAIKNLKIISGLGCKENKTSSIVMLDSLQHAIFAQRLGINLSRDSYKTGMAIINDETETVHVLKGSVTIQNTINFLRDYSKGNATIVLRSEESLPTPFSNINKGRGTEMDKNRIKIREISSKSFENRVLNSNKTSVVMFYSSQCSFCTLMAHYLLSISSSLKELSNLEFLRVDGDRNDFDVGSRVQINDGFPSLIIYPYQKKNESRVFPTTTKVSKQSVLTFILSNLQLPSRIQGIILLCKNLRRVSYVEECLQILRHEVSNTISICLKKWRTYPYKRKNILRVITLLRSIYLNLINVKSCDFRRIQHEIAEVNSMWNHI